MNEKHDRSVSISRVEVAAFKRRLYFRTRVTDNAIGRKTN